MLESFQYSKSLEYSKFFEWITTPSNLKVLRESIVRQGLRENVEGVNLSSELLLDSLMNFNATL